MLSVTESRRLYRGVIIGFVEERNGGRQDELETQEEY